MTTRKSIISGILLNAVLFMAVQVGVAQEKAADASDKVELTESVAAKVLASTVEKLNANKTKISPHLLLGGTFQYNGPNGGGTNDEWKEANTWSSITGSLPCPGDGEACMIEVPEDQTLQQFLDSKSSYQNLLDDDEHVEQRAP